eukprot:753000-Hanusia_phi.AAC.4
MRKEKSMFGVRGLSAGPSAGQGSPGQRHVTSDRSLPPSSVTCRSDWLSQSSRQAHRAGVTGACCPSLQGSPAARPRTLSASLGPTEFRIVTGPVGPNVAEARQSLNLSAAGRVGASNGMSLRALSQSRTAYRTVLLGPGCPRTRRQRQYYFGPSDDGYHSTYW